MKDENKTRAELIKELKKLRRENKKIAGSKNAPAGSGSRGKPEKLVDPCTKELSERRQIEEELIRIMKALESTSDAIGMSDPGGRHFYQNRAFSDMFGFKTAEELQSAGVQKSIYGDEETGKEVFKTIMSGDSWSGEIEMKSRNGRRFPVSLRADAIKDDEGKIIGLIGIHTDITEYKKAVNALMESENRFRSLIENISDMITVINGEGNVIYESPSVEKILGYKPEELHEKKAFDIIHPDDKEMLLKIFEKGISTPDFIINTEYRVRHKNGTWRTVEVTAKNLLGNPSVNGVVINSRDITARKMAEAELTNYRDRLEELVIERTNELKEAQEELLRREKFATLGKITATVNHELRNPLATIRASLFSIGEHTRDGSPLIMRALERAERSISRCDKIIEDLLNYTRVRELELMNTEIDKWLSRELNEIKLPDDVVLLKELNAGIKVKMDRERFRRCIINIIDNAWQAMEERQDSGPEVIDKIITVRSSSRDDRVEIQIEDTGPGIPEEDIKKIFEALYSTRSTGVGLGLPYVKQIIEQHKGGIDVKSEEGKGTMVNIWIPLLP